MNTEKTHYNRFASGQHCMHIHRLKKRLPEVLKPFSREMASILAPPIALTTSLRPSGQS